MWVPVSTLNEHGLLVDQSKAVTIRYCPGGKVLYITSVNSRQSINQIGKRMGENGKKMRRE